jgi:hypothetical protein
MDGWVGGWMDGWMDGWTELKHENVTINSLKEEFVDYRFYRSVIISTGH